MESKCRKLHLQRVDEKRVKEHLTINNVLCSSSNNGDDDDDKNNNSNITFLQLQAMKRYTHI
jgi:hypothetical protein